MMLKKDIQVIEKKGVHYLVENGRVRQFKPWLGDLFSFLYDAIMEKSIFPKKFGGDIEKHYDILQNAHRGLHGKRVLELATGSGSAVNFLENDNANIGTDISVGLLRQAVKRFAKAGFNEPEFYVTSADDLPFQDASFDVCLCHLSFNFFSDIDRVLNEIGRVLASKGILLGSVPVPEKKPPESKIRGQLYSEKEWSEILQRHGFQHESSGNNGAVHYFRATRTS